jgi:hypothetical protein
MSLRSYIGFTTNRTTTLASGRNPTTLPTVDFGGVFNTSLEDYDFTKNGIYISSSTTATSGGANVSSINVNAPSGIGEGDLLLTFIGVNNSGRTISSPGWSTETSINGGYVLSILTKRASASESSSYTFTITGGTANIQAIILCIKNCNLTNFGSFGANTAPVPISIPDDTSEEKLILFFASNIGSGRSYNVDGINEFQIVLLNVNAPSIEIRGIYSLFPNNSLNYIVAQDGGGTNSYGVGGILK